MGAKTLKAMTTMVATASNTATVPSAWVTWTIPTLLTISSLGAMMAGVAKNSGLDIKEETEKPHAVAAQGAFDSEDAPGAPFVLTRRNVEKLPPMKKYVGE